MKPEKRESQKGGQGCAGLLRKAVSAWRKGRDRAALQPGTLIAAPVVWAAFAVFAHPLWGSAGFLLHAFFILPRRKGGAAALLAAFVLLALWFGARAPHVSVEGAPFHEAFPGDTARAQGPAIVRTGVVAGIPAPTARGFTFLFRETARGKPDDARTGGFPRLIRGALTYRVTLEASTPPAWGAAVRLRGPAAPEDAPPNPGQIDMRRVLRGLGASASIRAESCEPVAPPAAWHRALTAAREALAASLTRNVPAPARPLLEASLLNITSHVPDETREAFARSGMQHILAISGQHIGLLLGFLLIAGLCVRLPRKAAFALAGLLAAAYIPVVGSPVSVVRSGLMFAILLPALFRDRPSAGLHALGLTAAVDLWFDPHNVANLGFQLSYAATLALILGARPTRQAAVSVVQALVGTGTTWITRVHLALAARGMKVTEPSRESNQNRNDKPRGERRPGRLAEFTAANLQMVFLSTLITLFTYPVLAASTHAVTPWGVLGNLATVPVGAAMLVGGLFTWGFDFLLPSSLDALASGAGAVSGLCAVGLEGMVFLLADLPHAVRPIAHPPAWWLAVLAAAPLSTAALLRRGQWTTAALCGLTLLAAEGARPAIARLADGGPRLTFLAVGHGDAIVLELPGAALLIDAGDAPRVARNVILPFLRFRGIATLDAALVTHADRDHYGGMAAVIAGIPVRRVIGPPEHEASEGSATWNCLHRVARERNVPWYTGRAGQRVYAGRSDTLWVLAPDTARAELANADKNDVSLVTWLKTPQGHALFNGDIEQAAQAALGGTWPLWRGAWLKAPHHGSDRTTSPCFLAAARAPRAVVSCGGRRGFPGHAVMTAFATGGTAVDVTKRVGAVTWILGRRGARAQTQFPPPRSLPSPEILN